MRFEQFELVVEIAKTNSISQAAENLFISRQSAGQSLSALENKLGAQIFERSKQGAVLTAEGEIVLPYAKQIIENIRYMSLELNNFLLSKYTDFSESINIYFSQLFYFAANNITENITNIFPNALLNVLFWDYDFLTEINSGEKNSIYFSAVFEKDLEIIKENSSWHIIVLKKEDLYLYTSEKNRKKFKNEVTLEELSSLPLVSFSSNKNSSSCLFQYLKDSQNVCLTASLTSNDFNTLNKNVLNGTHYALSYIDNHHCIGCETETHIIPIKDIEPLVLFAAYSPDNFSIETYPVIDRLISTIATLLFHKT